MNKIILISLFLVCFVWSAFGQKTQTSEMPEKTYKSNFVIVQGKLIWRKVFEDKVSLKDYERYLKLGAHLDNIEVSENDSLIIGRLRSKKLNLVGFDENVWTGGNVAPYLKWLMVNGDIKIEVKSDRYRITIYNFKLIAEITGAFWQKGEEDELEDYYYKAFSKKKYVSENFIQYSEPVFDKNFMDKFQYKLLKSDF